MTLTTIIVLVLALYMLQIFLQETSRFGFDVRGIVGNRDNQPEMTVMAASVGWAEEGSPTSNKDVNTQCIIDECGSLG